MKYVFFNLKNISDFGFFLIFVAAMSFVVCVAVRSRGKASQFHQQAPKTGKKAKSLWSEAEFRKAFSDYRRARVVFRLAASTIHALLDGGKMDPERRRRLVVRGYGAYVRMKELASEYNEMSRIALDRGKFPGGLPKTLNI